MKTKTIRQTVNFKAAPMEVYEMSSPRRGLVGAGGEQEENPQDQDQRGKGESSTFLAARAARFSNEPTTTQPTRSGFSGLEDFLHS